MIWVEIWSTVEHPDGCIFYINKDMDTIKRTDPKTNCTWFAHLFLTERNVYARSKWSNSFEEVKELSWEKIWRKFPQSRQKQLRDITFEIPLLLS